MWRRAANLFKKLLISREIPEERIKRSKVLLSKKKKKERKARECFW